MPISISCPDCASAYRVPDSAAGKAVKCKKCGAKVPVAANGSSSAAANGAAKKGGGAGKILLIVGGVLALGCLVCTGIGGLGTWWAYGKTRDAVTDIQKDVFLQVKDAKDLSKDAFKDLSKEFPKDAFKDAFKGMPK